MPPGDRALWFREQAGVRDELDETVGAKGSAAEVHEGWKIVIGNDIKSLVDALGGCERIQKTPMPFGYLAQQRIFMLKLHRSRGCNTCSMGASGARHSV